MAKKPRKSPVRPVPAEDTETMESSLPTSWRAGLVVISKYGVPSLLVIGLVYWIAVNNSSKLDQILERSAKLESDFTRLNTRLNDDANQAWMAYQVQQRICLNTSKTDEDRMACVTPTRKTP